MRLLSLLGSPRANGTTHTMARLIAGGLSGGGPVEEIALQEKHIRPWAGKRHFLERTDEILFE